MDWKTGEDGITTRPDEEDEDEHDQTSVDLAKPGMGEDATALQQDGHLGSGQSCLVNPD